MNADQEHIAAQFASGAQTGGAVSAAKLQVLALGPIKERLGAKWPRLSELVHKLFEAAIARAQGPQDSFVQIDELCYAAIFRGLSMDDTGRVCAGIAREVCYALFGEDIDDVSVRNVVAQIVLPQGLDLSKAGPFLDRAIEGGGSETIISEVNGRARRPAMAARSAAARRDMSALQRIQAAHDLLAETGLKMRFFPVWDLQLRKSSTLFLVAMSGSLEADQAVARADRGTTRARESVEIAIALLEAAAAYAERVARAQQVCAIGTEVSYEILSSARTRRPYLTSLRRSTVELSAPLVLKITQIPKGTPTGRIGELAALLRPTNIRVLLEFESVSAIPPFEFRINAKGIGSVMPRGLDDDLAGRAVKRTVDTASAHKLFVFLDELNSEPSLDLARNCGVRFGIGAALDTQSYSGLEPLPQFPIVCHHVA